MTTDETLTPDEAIVPAAEAVEASAPQPEPAIEAEAPVTQPDAVAAAEPTPAPDPEPVVAEPIVEEPAMDDSALFEAALDAWQSGDDGNDRGYRKLSRGDRVEATVIQVDNDRVFVDLGTKSEGIIPMSELTDDNINHPSEAVKAGDKIQVVVIRPEGAEGNPLVSKKRADFEDLWDSIEAKMKAETVIMAQVVDRVKGGLLVDIGVRGFVPATHVGSGRLRNIDQYVGQSIALKILEIDRERKKVVLSNRQADEERRASAKDELFQSVNPGDVVDGTVRRLTDYGAFIDMGGVDGLLHISEMSWARINHPREMFKEGQKIQVMVLRLDSATGKISLGHRQVLPDPWKLIRENYTNNQRFTTKIARMVVSGAFVKLPEGAEAFIPLSEMSSRRIRKPDEVVEVDQEVEVQIIDLRPDERRMVLSLRAAGATGDPGRMSVSVPSYDDDGRDKKKLGGKKTGKKGGRGRDDDYDDSVGRRGYATGGATIGERLGMLKGWAGRDIEDDELDAEAVVEADAAKAADAAETPESAPAE
ncbi:MAG: 30S ribosomal protein S1 [Fimbriimonadaceae bacterium]